MTDNVYMENLENFTKELFEVFDEKVRWYETEELPKMLEEYRKNAVVRGKDFSTEATVAAVEKMLQEL